MSDKSQWPESYHEFFMHPPLLTPVAGRPKIERHKGTGDKKKRKGQHQCPIIWTMDIIGIIAREADQKTLKLWKQSGNNLSSLLYHLCFSFVKYMILILFLFQGRTKEEGKEHQISPKFYCAFRGRCTSGIHVFSPKVWYFFLSHIVISQFWWILSTN